MAEGYYLYLVRTAAGALYTGISTDPQRRLEEHASGRGARALRGRGPLELVYSIEAGDRGRAQRLEAAVKALDAAAKRRILSGDLNPASLLGETTERGRS